MVAKKRKKKDLNGRTRLNLRLSTGLKRWAHDYAERHETTVTAIITQHLVILRESEREPDVESI